MSVRNLTISAGAIAAAFILLFLALGLYYQKGLGDYADLSDSASRLSLSLDRIDVLLGRPYTQKELAEEIKRAGILFEAAAKGLSTRRQWKKDPALVSGFSSVLAEWKETGPALQHGFKKSDESGLRDRLMNLSAEILSLSPLIRKDTLEFIRWYTKAAIIYSMVSIGVIWYGALFIIYRIVSPVEEAAKIVAEMNSKGAQFDPQAQIHGELKAMAERLAGNINESLARYRDLVDAMPEALIETDLTGRISFVNGVARTLTGYSEEDLIGRDFVLLLPPEAAPLLRDIFEVAINVGTVKDRELPIVVKGGNTRQFEFSCSPIRMGGEETAGFRLFGRDLDEQKRITEELKKAKRESEESSRKLKRTIEDLEEFALLAVRRELKMHEIRERFKKLLEERRAEGE